MRLCLIGKKLSHSFSRDIHTKSGLSYDLVGLREDELKDFFTDGNYDGFNVTIPYKVNAFNLVDSLDDTARLVGAVNTVIRKDGKTIGYNTDVGGMRYMLKLKEISVKDKTVLILGSGGACLSAKALCDIDGAKKVYICSRKGDINYSNVYEMAGESEILINCTPVGMYPNVNERLVDLSRFNNLKLVADCIYNPLKTALILDAIKLNIPCVSGLPMLVAQAILAQEIWLDTKIPTQKIDEIYSSILRQKTNIVLVGMPGSGKTSIGQILSERLGKEIIDTDQVITQEFGSPSSIIQTQGEGAFRDIESDIIKQVGNLNGKIISTGGGAILRQENIAYLKQNGLVVYVDRRLENLAKDDRPLSQTQGLENIFKIRQPIYTACSDIKVDNNGDIENAVKEIISYYENFSD